MRRAGDNRRFDLRQEEQPINKSNILSEHGQQLPTLFGKREIQEDDCQGKPSSSLPSAI
jgi:hypothetical protein